MNKKWFEDKTNDIDVPIDEVYAVIDRAIDRGRKQKNKRNRTRFSLSILSAAATMVLALGFVFSPVTNVLANVPIIGEFYESFNKSMGQVVENEHLVTEINHTVTNNGVALTLTSVFFDGIYIGITFRASGEELISKSELGDDNSTFEYDFYLYEEGPVRVGWGGGHHGLQQIGNDYIGAIELEYPEKELPKDFTLPITFTSIGGVEGNWTFNVPVVSIPPMTISIDETAKNDSYTFNLQSMTIGHSNMALYYETNISQDILKFDIVDDKGNEIANNSLYSIGSEKAVFKTGIKSETKYLLIYPTDYRDGQVVSLEPIKVMIPNQ
ncbi:DUF4179 domain-containing protein [Alkalihalobacillus sp. LMS39]|uniref:DUF4179 domain-containing protein n=1 Tax=Alkalihalobacillus sp. LMS39 TaxID=2924032 RepID=UPI001FB1C3F4|nr:DUF4179 domain-containing protein [Alkalihalobacillus sp. LMS39]UOE95281.1 DUF4179 domain-containing protein [Alkalihalobacillus sp. LMS39]